MKRRSSLYVKMLVGYILFAVLAFCLVNFYSAKMIDRLLISQKTDDIYTQAYSLSSYYDKNAMQDDEEDDSRQKILDYFRIFAEANNAHVWFVDVNGDVQLDSDWTVISDSYPTSFSVTDFPDGHSIVGNYLPGEFTDEGEESITVYVPLTKYYRVYGYIVISVPTSSTYSLSSYLQNIVYVTVLIVILLSLILLIVFTFTVYIPLRKVIVLADEYANGNFKPRPQVKTRDEMGYLAATLGFMAQQIEEAGEGQRKLVSNISHDFRSPLTSIKGYLEAILDGTIPKEMEPKYLNIVLDETQRLTKLSSNLLTLNTVGDNGTYLDMTEFDINHIIRKVASTFEGTCNKRNIHFDLIFSNVSLLVYADKDKIQQVLYNLVDNAIKFSPDGSIIMIETMDKRDKAFISVKDSGIGIEKDELGKIFNRFYKSDTSRGKDKKGTGLGLAITKEIITAHHESIDVISTPGVGTKFTFRLPLSRDWNDPADTIEFTEND